MHRIQLKRFFCLLVVVFGVGLLANAQLIRTEDLEKYAKDKYGDEWVEAAENLGKELQLDKNQALTFVQVIEAPGKSKSDLYVLLNYWYTSFFTDSKNVIDLNDKEAGVIIGKCYLDGVAEHVGGFMRYKVSISPIIKCDIKDGKVRVTCTVPFYYAEKVVGGGWVGIAADVETTKDDEIKEKWALDASYPFFAKDKHKKASSKALIMSHAYSNVIMDKIEESIKNGVSGNENDDW